MAIIRRLDVHLSRCYKPTRALDFNGLAGLENDLKAMDNFNATLSRRCFSIYFQFYGVKRSGAMNVGATVLRMLNAAIGEVFALRCDCFEFDRKTAVSSHQFVRAIIGRLIT